VRSIVIDTLRSVLSMPLVMAVTMNSQLVAEFLASTDTLRDEVIDFDTISIAKEEMTPAALPLLILQQSSAHCLC